MADASLIANAGYWRRHVLAPVRFYDGMQTLVRDGHRLFVEIGPNPVLIGLGQRAIPDGSGTWLPSLQKGKDDWSIVLHSLAALYTRGVNPKFAALDEGCSRRRVHAPTYPFQRRRLWFDTAPRGHASAPAPVPAIERSPVDALRRDLPGHDLLGTRLRSPLLDAVVFQSRCDGHAQSGLLSEHRIYGRIVVPGAYYLAMAVAAGTQLFGSRPAVSEERHHAASVAEEGRLTVPVDPKERRQAVPVELRDVIFHRPLVLSESDSRTVQLIVSRSPDATASMPFRVLSAPDGDDAAWVEHATGTLAANVEAGAAWPTEADGVGGLADSQSVERTGVQHANDFFYRPAAELGLDLGPLFRWMTEIQPGNGEACCRMHVPEGHEPADASPLPPGFADSCLQALVASLPAAMRNASVFVPIGVRTLRWRAPLVSHGSCHARVRGTMADIGGPADDVTGDVVVCDESGQPSIALEGIHLRRAPQTALLRGAHANVLYQIGWHPAPPATLPQVPTADSPSQWVIVTGTTGVGPALAARLEARGDRCMIVAAGNGFADPELRERLARVIADSARTGIDGVLGFICDFSTRDAMPVASWPTAAFDQCCALLHLAQALAPARQRVKLWVVTAGAQPVTPAAMVDRQSVAQGSVWGLCRVLASEMPELECRLLDLDPAHSTEAAATLIENELATRDLESQVAYRAGVRYVPRLVPHHVERPSSPVGLRRTARYLITGGTGGLGLRVAQWMIARGARHLILMARGAMSPLAADAVAELRRHATVDVVQGDVSTPGEVRRILESGNLAAGHAERLPLHGVIHAAGVLDDGVLLHQDSARLAAVLAPKVDGSVNLHLETLNQPLDFFVLFSSAASILGPDGQATYAAANAFLDAFAHYRHATGLPALSVSWGPWATVGMASGIVASGRRLERGGVIARGFEPIEPDDGVELLGQMISGRATHVAALPIRWAGYASALVAGRVPALVAELVRKASASSAPPGRTAQDARAVEPTFACLVADAAPASRAALVAAHVHELVARVMGLDGASSLAPAARFFDAGMDSLMALELHRCLQAALGPAHRLPSTIVFDHPTIDSLAAHLLTVVGGDVPVARTAAGVAPAAADDDADAKLEHLSQTQVEAILDERLTAIEALEQRG